MTKFWRGHRVKIADEFPKYMAHFGGRDCIAIVSDYTIGNGGWEDSYALLYLGHDGVWHSAAWYPESLLTLIGDDRDDGERILQEYS